MSEPEHWWNASKEVVSEIRRIGGRTSDPVALRSVPEALLAASTVDGGGRDV
jgi:hypothetical protein